MGGDAVLPDHPPQVLDVHVEHLRGQGRRQDLGIAARRRGSIALGKGHAVNVNLIWDDYE
jgi:hypothetical protein